jgi:hypothetical protein
MLIPRKVFPQGVRNLGAKALYLDLIAFCMALRNFISQLFTGNPLQHRQLIFGKNNKFFLIDSKFC